MQIQLSWIRHLIPRGVQPMAKGTNTLVFPGRDNHTVDVFMLCGAKYDWWHECDLIVNPNENHFISHHEVKGYLMNEPHTVNLTLRRVQAKRLFKPENGSPQKKAIIATCKAMDAIWTDLVCNSRFGGSWQQERREYWAEFWNRLIATDLPVKDLAYFATDYYVAPDIGPRNALVDDAGNIVWSDMFIMESVAEFVRMRKDKVR